MVEEFHGKNKKNEDPNLKNSGNNENTSCQNFRQYNNQNNKDKDITSNHRLLRVLHIIQGKRKNKWVKM